MDKKEFNEKLDVFLQALRNDVSAVPNARVMIESRSEVCCRVVIQSLEQAPRVFLAWLDKAGNPQWGEEALR